MKATRFFWLILLGTACAFGGSALYVVQKDLEPQVQAVTALVEKEEACPPAQDCVMRDADSEKIIESIISRVNEPWSAVQVKINNTVVQVFSQVGQFHWMEPYRAPIQSECSGSGFSSMLKVT